MIEYVFLGALAFAVLIYFIYPLFSSKPVEAPPPPKEPAPKKRQKIDITRKYAEARKTETKDVDALQAESERVLLRDLKGHQGDIFQAVFAAEGNVVCSSAADSTVRCWTSVLTEKTPRYLLFNIKSESASAVGIDKDVTICVCAGESSRKLYIYQLVLKDGRVSLMPETEVKVVPSGHTESISRILFNQYGTFFVTMASGEDTSLSFWTSSGKLVATIQTRQLMNNDVAMSFDGSYLAVAAKLGDVKIWECVCEKGTHALTSVVHVGDLKGHPRAVMSLAFSPDNKRMVTSCLDGSLRLWDIAVRFKDKEDTKLLFTHPCKEVFSSLRWPPSSVPSRFFAVSESCDALTCLSVSPRNDITEISRLPGLHRGPIGSLDFALTASSSGSSSSSSSAAAQNLVCLTAGRDDKHMRVWNCSDMLLPQEPRKTK